MTVIAVGLANVRASWRPFVYLALLSLAVGYLASDVPVEIWPTESWNAYLQDAAATGALFGSRINPGLTSGHLHSCPSWLAFTTLCRTKTSTAHRVALIEPGLPPDLSKICLGLRAASETHDH